MLREKGLDVTGDVLFDVLMKYRCHFATEESDVMNYRIPTGPRIRYRPMKIVRSGTNEFIEKYDSQWECLQNADCGVYN